MKWVEAGPITSLPLWDAIYTLCSYHRDYSGWNKEGEDKGKGNRGESGLIRQV